MARALLPSLALILSQAWPALSLPQGLNLPRADAGCDTTETWRYGVATTITDYRSFVNSMNSAYSTSGVPFTGERILIYTTTATALNGAVVTAYGYYDSDALTQAGYTIVSSLVTSVSCPPTTTETLPPSPTGSICSPHGDHCKYILL